MEDVKAHHQNTNNKEDLKHLDNITEIVKKHYESDGSFMSLKQSILNGGYKVSFATDPIPNFLITNKPSKNIIICNVKYVEADNDTRIVKDTAIGWI